MIKIRLLSDLHIEGFPFKYEHRGEDVVVLAGDIHGRNCHERLLDQIPTTTQIVMVAGNHEFYFGEYFEVIEFFNSLKVKYPNFHFLDDSAVTINGVEFFGGTMCTDFMLNGDDPIAEIYATHTISDFRLRTINEGEAWRRWTTKDHIKIHTNFCERLDAWLKTTENKKRVVISHFMPSPKAIHPRWQDKSINSYFAADMERFMGWDGMWLYGHTHDSGDFMVGKTRVVGNPKGYGNQNEHFNYNLILEVE